MNNRLKALRQKSESQFFYAKHIDEIGARHVAWIDLMGILDHLKNKQIYPAVLRGELLSVVSDYIDHEKVELFTAGDGLIIITEDKSYLYDFLGSLMEHYVRFNVENWRDGDDIWLNRLLRAGVGYGDIHKIDLEGYARDNRRGNPFTTDFSNDPFGPGIINALRAERGSPYSTHEYQSDETIEAIQWWDHMNIDYDLRVETVEMLSDYFDWYDSKRKYQYSPHAQSHLDKAVNYFQVDQTDLGNP